MTNNEIELMKIILSSIDYNLCDLNWKNEDIGFWIDGIIFTLSADHSTEFFNELYELRNIYLGLESE